MLLMTTEANIYKQMFQGFNNIRICFISSLKLNWAEAEIYSKLLCENSKWSRTIYTYQRAVVMLMRDPAELTVVDVQTIEKLMK